MFTRRASAAAVAAVVTLFGANVVLNQDPNLKARVKTLEARVAKLESHHRVPAAAPLTETQPREGKFLVLVTITNKRFAEADPIGRGTFQDNIWWDSRYDLSQLKKPARAIKGVLEFRDLFGEAKFKINVTITEEVSAESEHISKGIGFTYNLEYK